MADSIQTVGRLVKSSLALRQLAAIGWPNHLNGRMVCLLVANGVLAMSKAETAQLYYIHDPMCSWCWGFVPVLHDLLKQLPDTVRVTRLLGGLAPDTDVPMPAALRQTIEATWQRIQKQVPGTAFNFDFWTRCQPRRSTWPACRAVLAARLQGDANDVRMTQAIQRAYYTQARNPSDDKTLVSLAEALELDALAFTAALRGAAVQQQLQAEIALSRQLQVSSFPSLVLKTGSSEWRIAVDYNDSTPMLELIADLMQG